MGHFWRGFATRMGFIRQYVWLYRITALGLAMAVYGVASVVWTFPIVTNIGTAVVGLGLSAVELAEVRRQLTDISFPERKGDEYDDVIAAEAATGRKLTPKPDVGLLLTAPTALLRSKTRVNVTVAEATFVPRPQLRRYALPYLSARARTSAMFNGDVVGLASDLPEPGEIDAEVHLHRCAYFDFVSTNEFAQADVRRGNETVFSGRNLFVRRNGRLRTITDSWLANVIGISTLAFTKDGKLIIAFQTKESVGSPRRLAPSGSGALEQKDLDAGGSLEDIIVRGVNRELCEETRIKPDEIEGTRLIGFGRWLTRGAMPEFSAVTLVNADSHDICARPVSRSEAKFVKSVSATRLLPIDTWDPDAPGKMLPDELDRWIASFPLVLALSALAECVVENSEIGALIRDRVSNR